MKTAVEGAGGSGVSTLCDAIDNGIRSARFSTGASDVPCGTFVFTETVAEGSSATCGEGTGAFALPSTLGATAGGVGIVASPRTSNLGATGALGGEDAFASPTAGTDGALMPRPNLYRVHRAAKNRLPG